jgi:hypothetical protein
MAVNWATHKPNFPQIGDCYMDLGARVNYTWTGLNWVEITDDKFIPSAAALVPTNEQLEKHPSLKQAWDEYIVIRKLLGL